MKMEQFNDRNVTDNGYFLVDIEDYPTDGWGKFKRVVKRTFKGDYKWLKNRLSGLTRMSMKNSRS